MQFEDIQFNRMYWGVPDDLLPCVLGLRLKMKCRRYYIAAFFEEFQFEVVGPATVDYPLKASIEMGIHRFFETLEEACAAAIWLDDKPGRALFNYGTFITTDH